MRILVANFFPAFHPPRSGGEQRYYYLYDHLSRHHDITLLSPTYSTAAHEVVTFSTSFREHRVPKSAALDRLHWQLDKQGIGPECSGYVVALGGGLPSAYGQEFAALARDADLIIHECPFTLPYDVGFGTDGKPRIYDAYNVEHRLAAQILQGDAGRKAVEFIRFLEQALVQGSALVLATSEEERQLFSADFGVDAKRVVLAPNGFEPHAEDSAASAGEPASAGAYAVFMGSAHPPNVEAALFVVERLAPELPHIQFRIMGTVCDHLPKELPGNVKALGFVDEAEKRRQLAGCGAALNPLFRGAGTNLKMLDYMAAGAPVVATPVGVRGLDLRDGVDARIVGAEGFAQAVHRTFGEPDRARNLGLAGKNKVFADYTWEHIAGRVRGALESVVFPRSTSEPGGQQTLPSLLVVNDFSVAVPTGGGQVRIKELLSELGRDFNVVLLCFGDQSRRSTMVIAPGVREIMIPKTDAHRDAEYRASGISTISVNDVLASEFCLQNVQFVDAFSRLAREAVAVVFEHPYLAPLLALVPPDKPVVYSSLNVEADLKAAMLQSRPDSQRFAQRTAALERELLRRADLVVCVSEADMRRFQRDRRDANYVVVENGVRCGSLPAPTLSARVASTALAGRKLAIFIGSGHMPNIAAAMFVIEQVAPMVPEVTFGIIGSVCDAIRLAPRGRNVVLFGVLSASEKDELLKRATFAVNPMFDGGGSSLKVPDFFVAGLPVVSTRTGMRGYDVRDGQHYLEAAPQQFADKVRAVATDDSLRATLGRAARHFAATRLDWRVLGATYRRALRTLVARKPRLLVVSYRFADPPPGGAEAYLVNTLRELAAGGRFEIDVAVPDVQTISNKWHFSAEYGRGTASPPKPRYLGRLLRFEPDAPADTDFDACAHLFRVWMSETRAQARRLPQDYEGPTLLGGWNLAEAQLGAVARWTSVQADLYIGAAATGIRIVGYSAGRTCLRITRSDHTVTRACSGAFDFTLELPGTAKMLTLQTDSAVLRADDPRELGVRINEMVVFEGSRPVSIDMAEDFETVWRRNAPEQWIRSLIEVTRGRSEADDELFARVRGPRSAALERWLEDNIATYDVVLAQGIPFATPLHASAIAQQYGVPLVLLPHFHVEDRYYHWQSYYELMRRAQCVIAFPSQIKTTFLDVIGARSSLVPGGGVHLSEFDPQRLQRAAKTFRALHDGPGPFVLVLGRKAGAKNYPIAIAAAQIVNQGSHRVDVVMIGPDEDGAAIGTPNVYCYGAQPRDIVLGALAACLCVVNMSESESFGIVLLEAWLAGRPVIAQRRCLAFADLVEPGVNGFLAGSSAEVADSVTRYLDDESLARQHGSKGAQLARSYGWGAISRQIEAILAQAIGNALPYCAPGPSDPHTEPETAPGAVTRQLSTQGP